MKIQLLFCALTACISAACYSQEKYPSVVASGGGETNTRSLTWEWTLGEVVAQMDVSSKNMYTQGYHQPVLSIEKVGQNPEINKTQIDVFPNPATSVINLRIGFDHALPLTIILLDSKGSFLLQREVPARVKLVEMNVSRFSNGAYILQVRHSDGRILQNYQVIKAR